MLAVGEADLAKAELVRVDAGVGRRAERRGQPRVVEERAPGAGGRVDDDELVASVGAIAEPEPVAAGDPVRLDGVVGDELLRVRAKETFGPLIVGPRAVVLRGGPAAGRSPPPRRR